MGSPENNFNSDLDNEFDLSPEITERQRPILFVPGWNAKLSEYKDALKRLVFEGKSRVLSVVPDGTEEEKVESLLQFLDLKGLEEVDVISHSLGAMSAVAAALRDSRIKRLVLLNPPDEEHDPKGLIKKYKDMLNLEGTKNAADVGAKKIVEMARTITAFDMQGMRERLSSIGTKVASINGLSDKLFPPPPTAQQLDDAAIESGQDRFYVEANHSNVVPLIPFALRLLDQP